MEPNNGVLLETVFFQGLPGFELGSSVCLYAHGYRLVSVGVCGLKRELWKAVKTGDLVVYADQYDGVFRAKIVAVDIRVSARAEAGGFGYPYGKTAVSGTVKIEWETVVAGRRVKQTGFENLVNLIVYSIGRLSQLKRKWNSWQAAKSSASSLEADFLVKVGEYRVI